MARPKAGDYAAYYEKYLALVPEENIVETLEKNLGESLAVLREIPDSRGQERHAPYTWSVNEVVGHIVDGERIFGYRALRFGRVDTTPLPGFEQDPYVAAGEFDRRRLSDLTREFELARRSNIELFQGFPDAAWARRGEASGNAITVRAVAYILVGHARHHMGILRKRIEGAAA